LPANRTLPGFMDELANLASVWLRGVSIAVHAHLAPIDFRIRHDRSGPGLRRPVHPTSVRGPSMPILQC
jgi:hypothetical protein